MILKVILSLLAIVIAVCYLVIFVMASFNLGARVEASFEGVFIPTASVSKGVFFLLLAFWLRKTGTAPPKNL